ncbi:MAG: amidohydrolase family protein [Desulfobacteraceae bacterium]|nr:amidohydrolase family protein [Desulfobacteraceae bacterium]
MDTKANMDRRSFLKASALLGSTLFAGTSGLYTMTGCGKKTDWKSIYFPKMLLKNLLLFDGSTNTLQKDKIILIQDNKILSIENQNNNSQYADFKVVDLKGRTLMPGLIDNHVHITSPFITEGNMKVMLQLNYQAELNFKNCIMSGVTTVRDVGGSPGMVNKFKAKADQNHIPGPRVISSLSMIAARNKDQFGWPTQAPLIENPIVKKIFGGNFAERPQTASQMAELCETLIGQGAAWLKTLHQDQSFHHKHHSLPNHTDDAYKAMLKVGEKHGIRCAIHAMFASGFQKGVDIGFHTLEHTPMNEVISDFYIEKFKSNKTAIMPTLTVYGNFFIRDQLIKLLKEKGHDYLAPEPLTQMTQAYEKVITLMESNQNEKNRADYIVDPLYFTDMYPNVVKNIQKLVHSGAKIGIGTDAGTPTVLFGFYADELRYLSSAGLSNFQILKMATNVNAKILGMQDKIGTVETGKRADLIAVEGNPLQDLDILYEPHMVMKAGTIIKGKDIAGSGS